MVGHQTVAYNLQAELLGLLAEHLQVHPAIVVDEEDSPGSYCPAAPRGVANPG